MAAPLQWCTPTDITTYGANALALVEVPNATLVTQCIAATSVMASFLRDRFPVDDPSFQVLDTSITMYTAWIAAYLVFAERGYDPAAGSDLQIKEKYDAAIAWGKEVAKGAFKPLVSFNPPPGRNYQLPAVYTHKPRGWS